MSEIQLEKIQGPFDKGAVLDVVFVHGLGGNLESTWHPHGNTQAYWPQWIANDLPKTQVWSLGYPAGPTLWLADSSRMGVLERSRNILHFLSVTGLGERPIVFVAHSLGGLMVKQLLRTASSMQNSDWHKVLGQVRGVAFLATPHTGSSLANLAKAASLMFRASAVTKDLAKGSDYLADLNDWFRQNTSQLDIGVEAYYETEPVKGAVLVVNSASANPGVSGCVPVPVDGDHFSMCKPLSQQSLVYLSVKKFVNSFLAGKSWRVYSIPGYSKVETMFHDAIRASTSCVLDSIVEEDAYRLNHTVCQSTLSDQLAHVFVISAKGVMDRGSNELDSMLELIRSARSVGRDLPQKPIFALYGSNEEIDRLLGSLRPKEATALAQYFRLHPEADQQKMRSGVDAFLNRIYQEWTIRPNSLPGSL
jgi:pimeloyl-ACP methyl ester carboxylesterase